MRRPPLGMCDVRREGHAADCMAFGVTELGDSSLVRERTKERKNEKKNMKGGDKSARGAASSRRGCGQWDVASSSSFRCITDALCLLAFYLGLQGSVSGCDLEKRRTLCRGWCRARTLVKLKAVPCSGESIRRSGLVLPSRSRQLPTSPVSG